MRTTLVFKTAASSDTTVNTGYTFGGARLLFREKKENSRISRTNPLKPK